MKDKEMFNKDACVAKLKGIMGACFHWRVLRTFDGMVCEGAGELTDAQAEAARDLLEDAPVGFNYEHTGFSDAPARGTTIVCVCDWAVQERNNVFPVSAEPKVNWNGLVGKKTRLTIEVLN